MGKAVQMIGPGGVDRLALVDAPEQMPGQGLVRIRHEAIGANFIDIYHRTGLYPLPYPAVLGIEGAGVVEAVGDDVTEWRVGDRAAYAGAPVGAYATTRLLPVARLVRLPDDVAARTAAATIFKGLTAHMLLTETYCVSAGDILLVHAAAGGLGGLLVRWAKHIGATVIGTAGSPAKAAVARAHGADHVIVGRDADIVAEVGKLTQGRGVDFAIDGIGGDMLRQTLACVRRFGTVASTGQAAGPIPPLDLEELGPVRSLSLARPSIMGYTADMDRYHRAAQALMAVMRAGIVADIGGEYPLAQADRAQADLETGRTTGSLILLP
ncbi:quinone oxidoreductase [Pseudolabrys taiwanensis]|uniref:Quinone oxidoreductase n=1 Tax=Pseudolabrys taiwanensis TaxID=331696 RepID=A0A345ZQT3_9HYPH|nr:quinone oxidoreductase [Pseudolabrys taiwanensis]AXK79280.1 quinone oxidoreductase [Pseudolabrys taiwanensis]